MPANHSEERQQLRQQLEALVASCANLQKQIEQRMVENETHLAWQGSQENATEPPPPGTLNVHQLLQARKETYTAIEKLVRDLERSCSTASLLPVPAATDLKSEFELSLHQRFEAATPPGIVADDLQVACLTLRRLISSLQVSKTMRAKSHRNHVHRDDDPAALRVRIRELHESGWKTPEEICQQLDQKGTPRPRQARWRNLSWEKALGHTLHRDAVRTYISKAIHGLD